MLLKSKTSPATITRIRISCSRESIENMNNPMRIPPHVEMSSGMNINIPINPPPPPMMPSQGGIMPPRRPPQEKYPPHLITQIHGKTDIILQSTDSILHFLSRFDANKTQDISNHIDVITTTIQEVKDILHMAIEKMKIPREFAINSYASKLLLHQEVEQESILTTLRQLTPQ